MNLIIGGHIDSIKFSGDLISGLSLSSTRTMNLVRDLQQDNLSFIRDECERKVIQEALEENEHQQQTSKNPIISRKQEERFPKEIQLVLPPRSVYIMKGLSRYHYSHAVLGKSSHPPDPNVVEFKRRISLIFRN